MCNLKTFQKIVCSHDTWKIIIEHTILILSVSLDLKYFPAEFSKNIIKGLDEKHDRIFSFFFFFFFFGGGGGEKWR